MPRRPKDKADAGTGHATREDEPLAVGRAVRDTKERRSGVVVDCACQYAHPKARPVYNYLVRWEDGQIQAICESAFSRDYGLETVD